MLVDGGRSQTTEGRRVLIYTSMSAPPDQISTLPRDTCDHSTDMAATRNAPLYSMYMHANSNALDRARIFFTFFIFLRGPVLETKYCSQYYVRTLAYCISLCCTIGPRPGTNTYIPDLGSHGNSEVKLCTE